MGKKNISSGHPRRFSVREKTPSTYQPGQPIAGKRWSIYLGTIASVVVVVQIRSAIITASTVQAIKSNENSTTLKTFGPFTVSSNVASTTVKMDTTGLAPTPVPTVPATTAPPVPTLAATDPSMTPPTEACVVDATFIVGGTVETFQAEAFIAALAVDLGVSPSDIELTQVVSGAKGAAPILLPKTKEGCQCLVS